MALPATDSFVGASGTLPDPPWHQQSATVTRDGSGNATATGSDITAVDDANTYSNDQYSQFQIVTVSAGAYCEIIARGSLVARTFYAFYANTGSDCGIIKYIAGASTFLKAVVTTLTAGDVMKIQVVGTTISVFKNGSLITTQTDASIASGAAGIGFESSGKATNWQADNVGASAAPIGKLRAFTNQARVRAAVM